MTKNLYVAYKYCIMLIYKSGILILYLSLIYLDSFLGDTI